MTQDMGNKISHHNQAVARELAGSRQALGRLMSMVRSRQGASKEQARSWLGYGLEVRWRCHGYLRSWERGMLRYATMIVMMMVVGVTGVWGQF